jgi:hypothetical protein
MHNYFCKQNNFKALFILFTFIFIVLMISNIFFPHEAFAMEPNTDDIIRSFNPDTYNRHELDSKPISNVNKSQC